MSARGDGLIRLDTDGRILTREEYDAIWQRVKGFVRGGGTVSGAIESWWTGELRWARNRVSLASDRRDTVVIVTRMIDGREYAAITNQVDDASLEATVRAAERQARLAGNRDVRDFLEQSPTFDLPKTAIWSDATSDLTAEAREDVVRAVTGPAEERGMLSAGYLEVRALSTMRYQAGGKPPVYSALTQAQCSMTVRDAQGTGSGWAGLTSYDWSTINAKALAERALQKAIDSRNPVSLEPGRYTVILEPQAVHDLVTIVIDALDRESAERGLGPFTLGSDPALDLLRTKLGLRVMDDRITISHDPNDPQLGVVPFDAASDVEPRNAVKWIDHGVLAAMSDHRDHALVTRSEERAYPQSGSFWMSGGDTSIEAMIASTKRGLLVTRFTNTRVLDPNSLLSTGLTRDGLWLIENGEITKAVKNFRFTESPLFVLNSIEQLGPSVPVFRPIESAYTPEVTPAIVPPLKARDFSFTSLIDAV